MRDRVAYRRAIDLLDTGDDESDLACAQRFARFRFRRAPAKTIDQVTASRGHYADLVADLQRAVHYPHQRDDAHIVVEPRVDDQRLQRRLRIAAWRGDSLYQRFQKLGHALAGLGADEQRIMRFDADDLLDLLNHLVRVGGRQVDLVDHRHYRQALLERGVAVRDALRLDSLRGVDDQQRAFASRQGARDFVGEIDVSRRVDEIELVAGAVLRLVLQGDALRLDGDAPFALQVHRIEHLRLHFARLQAAAQLDEAVSQCRFAVVDVSDDGKVADVLHRGGGLLRARGLYVLPRELPARGPGCRPAGLQRRLARN